MGWLVNYAVVTPGVEVGDNATVRLSLNNEPQPDALMRIQQGGSSAIDEEGYVVGPPELIVEVAASSTPNDLQGDLQEKKQVYCRNGVQEYIVWQVEDQVLTWFYRIDDRYQTLQANSEGIICSFVFPGLWLAVPALLQNDLASVFTILGQGLASSAHQEFVEL
jgi:Uma2 family endonuclease